MDFLILADVSQKEIISWACFVVGISLLLVGTGVGLWKSIWDVPKKADEKIKETEAKLLAAQAAVATDEAASATDAAKKGLEELKGIIGSLPENLRFAGLLILVGALLMSVGTVQLGGVSIF